MENAMDRAVELLNEGGYTLVIVTDQVITSTERGVKPLLRLFDEGTNVRGGICADRVVGKAAAMLYLLLGVKEVYADVMSTLAKETLLSHNIKAECALEAPRIVNRAGDGFCPMEDAVKDIDDPASALLAIRARLKTLAS